MLKKISLLTLLTLGSISASDTLKPILQMGYDWGGTTLATVHHDDYYDQHTEKIRAGEGLTFEAGATVDNPNSNMELRFLIGYKFDYDDASNGDVTWDTVPFTALAMFKADKWRFGGGLTYHLNPKLSGGFGGDDVSSTEGEYKSALGGVAQVQYMATDSFAVGIKGTFIEYELKSDPTYTAKGNSIGFVASYTFGNERSEFR